jgi:hypothetical protein
MEINECVTKLIQILRNCGKDMKVTEKTDIPINQAQPKWFDEDCKSLKNTKCKLLNIFRAFRDETCLRDYLETKNTFKNLCKEKEKLYREELQHNLCNCVKDSNEFWKMVKKIRAYQSSNNRKQVDIFPAAWLDYFQKLLNPELSKTKNNFTEEVQEFLLQHNNNCERCEIEDDSDILNTENYTRRDTRHRYTSQK